MLHYTEMKAKHYEAALALWKQTKEIILTVGDSKEAVAAYLKRNPGLSFVCINKKTKELAGTVLCGHDGRRGFIYHLAVKNNYRGKAIGSKLMELALNNLKEQGIERCIIMVKNFNETGQRFWKKTGWKKRKELFMYSIDLK